MSHPAASAEFPDLIAARITHAQDELAARWLARLKELLPIGTQDIFPGHDLLDHIPALVTEIADYLRAPAEEAIGANTSVLAKAKELGELRHAQRASVHQVIREYRILRGVLAHFIGEETDRLGWRPLPAELLFLINKLDDAIGTLLQATVDTFIAEYSATIAQQTERLQSFNRLVSHEFRQPLGATQFALKLLMADSAADDGDAESRYLAVADRNVARMAEMIDKLASLSQMRDPDDNATVQRVALARVAHEAARQLREMSQARGVDIRIGADLPDAVIDVARLELILVNLISNAIKYSDSAKPERWVEVAPAPSSDGRIAIQVRDNGIGIPASALGSIFTRLFRAHTERDRELGTNGLGLGLSIVLDCVNALSGDIRVESTEGVGTAFFIDLPDGALDKR